MLKKLLTFFTLLLLTYSGFCQSDTIALQTNDTYDKYVEQLEAGILNINYQVFKQSFLESDEYHDGKMTIEEHKLVLQMLLIQHKKKNYQKIIGACNDILKLDYTNMSAHNMLGEIYTRLGDTTDGRIHTIICRGLVDAAMSRGDGKTQKTAWPIVQPDEEHFILEVVLGKKIIDDNMPLVVSKVPKRGSAFDIVTVEGGDKYYFDIGLVYDGYQKSFLRKKLE